MSFGPVLADAPTQLPLIFDATPLDIWHSSSSIRRPREKNICLQKAVCSAGTAMESRTRKQRPQKNAKKFDGLLTSSSEAFKHASLEPPLLQLLALISRTLKTKTKVYHGSSHQVPSAPRDGYVWRKYGQKPLVGTTLTRCALFLARAAPNDHKQCHEALYLASISCAPLYALLLKSDMERYLQLRNTDFLESCANIKVFNS